MKELSFFAPGLKHYDEASFSDAGTCGLTAVSVTGSACALQCKHCGASILRSMKAAATPEALLNEAETAFDKGSPGLLISGGSRPDGSVPLEPFLETIALIKKRFQAPVLLHTGLITHEVARGLSEAGVDCVMIDIIGDRDTIKEVCHLNAAPDDYARSLEILASCGVPTAPHVIMGLHFGQIRGEEAALDIISRYPARAVVMVGFRPIPGTAMGQVKPLPPEDMGRLISLARKRLPSTPLLLGCERPLGEHREQTDILALEAGVDGVAFPSESAIRWARDHSANITMSRTCCSLISIPEKP